MAQDFARKKSTGRKKAPARRKQPARNNSGGNGLRWFGAGVVTGVFLCFLLYLGTLPPATAPATATAETSTGSDEREPPKPRFDFYTMLPEQRIEEDLRDPAPATATAANPPEAGAPRDYYLLQAGSFRQQEDADRRRAELLLLGLEPTIRESTGDNGRWFRVYLGPFETRATMSRARSLTAAQNIDTLILKRSG